MEYHFFTPNILSNIPCVWLLGRSGCSSPSKKRAHDLIHNPPSPPPRDSDLGVYSCSSRWDGTRSWWGIFSSCDVVSGSHFALLKVTLTNVSSFTKWRNKSRRRQECCCLPHITLQHRPVMTICEMMARIMMTLPVYYILVGHLEPNCNDIISNLLNLNQINHVANLFKDSMIKVRLTTKMVMLGL